jgi:hypothetical protein
VQVKATDLWIDRVVLDQLISVMQNCHAEQGLLVSGFKQGVKLQVAKEELPPEKWFTIKSIVRDMELHGRDWAADLLAGYFCQALAP